MDKIKIDDMWDLVSVIMPDLYSVTRDHETKTINIYFWFFKKEIIIKLPVDEIMDFKNSASNFLDYLKGKITERVREELNG